MTYLHNTGCRNGPIHARVLEITHIARLFENFESNYVKKKVGVSREAVCCQFEWKQIEWHLQVTMPEIRPEKE